MPNIADNLDWDDIHYHRPWIEDDGRTYINVYNGKGDKSDIDNYSAQPVTNGRHGTLREDEWIKLDNFLVDFSKYRRFSRFNGINDLIGYKLVENTTNHIPLLISCFCRLNKRGLKKDRKWGIIDTSMAEIAARSIFESLEKMLFTNTTSTYSNKTTYSYINHPDRNTATFENSINWADKTPDGIIKDVLTMKKTLIDKHFSGPYVIYIPPAYWTVLDRDYDNTRKNTIRQYILSKGIKDIRPADFLPDNNVLMVNMTSDTVRLLKALPLTNIEYSAKGPLATDFAVITRQVPQIRSNAEGQIGLVHMC